MRKKKRKTPLPGFELGTFCTQHQSPNHSAIAHTDIYFFARIPCVQCIINEVTSRTFLLFNFKPKKH